MDVWVLMRNERNERNEMRNEMRRDFVWQEKGKGEEERRYLRESMRNERRKEGIYVRLREMRHRKTHP